MISQRRLAVVGLLLFTLPPAAETLAQPSFEVLHSFAGLPGASTSSLVTAADGTNYGLAAAGGPAGAGLLFKLQSIPTGTLVVTLHEFNGLDGRSPLAALIQGTDGALYGTTYAGGAARRGTIFKFAEPGGFTLLHTFGGPDGSRPAASLIQASDGLFYGTTTEGGTTGFGTVFSMTADGTVTTVHSFLASEGSRLASPVVEGPDGHLYGLSYARFPFPPTVFRLTRAGSLTVLHQFGPAASGVVGLTRATDGYFHGAVRPFGGPVEFFRISPSGAYETLHTLGPAAIVGDTEWSAPLLRHTDGALYGMLPLAGPNGHGTAFRLTLDGRFSVLLAPDGFQGRSYAGLIPGGPDHFYGVTFDGGIADRGSVFSLTTGGSFFHVTGFTGPGAFAPLSTPVRGPDGALYGTTVSGGLFGQGTVYRLDVSGDITVRHMFGFQTGTYPLGGLVLASDGFFYGTMSGGCQGLGGVFRISPAGGFATVVHCFRPGEGSTPAATLVAGSDGNLYGTTPLGGANGFGTAFRVTPGGPVVTIHSFDLLNSFPVAPLVEGQDGSLYGTTVGVEGTWLGGSVFRLTPSGVRTTLRLFALVPGSSSPHYIFGGLAPTPDGAFVGNTVQPGGAGQVFRITPSGEFATLATIPVGSGAYTTPVVDPAGNIYGTLRDTRAAIATSGRGAIYRVRPGALLGTVKILTALEGELPLGSLLRESDGSLLGAALAGGPTGQGVIFRFRPNP